MPLVHFTILQSRSSHVTKATLRCLMEKHCSLTETVDLVADSIGIRRLAGPGGRFSAVMRLFAVGRVDSFVLIGSFGSTAGVFDCRHSVFAFLRSARAVRRAAPSSRLPRYCFFPLSTQAFLSELSASVDARYCTCSARKTPFTTSKTSRCN